MPPYNDPRPMPTEPGQKTANVRAVSPEQELAEAEQALQRAYATRAGTTTLLEAHRRYRSAVGRWISYVRERVAP